MRKILFIFFIMISAVAFAQNYSIELNQNWQFSRAGTNKWYPAIVPGSVYTDLLRNKLIPDPFYSDNEKKVQWVDTCDWLYKTMFAEKEFKDSSAQWILNFAGLDTYADVYLNGKIFLKADNMFRNWQILLKKSDLRSNNELIIYFHSAKKITDSIAKAAFPVVLPDNNRVYARKAQFQFGWDWGPKLINCGIWKEASFSRRLSIKLYDTKFKIEDLKNDSSRITLMTHYKAINADDRSFIISVNEKNKIETLAFSGINGPSTDQYDTLSFLRKKKKDNNVEYDITVNESTEFKGWVLQNKQTISINTSFTKLVQRKDSIGESFYFEKDGKPVYIKGANWIPANIFLPAATGTYDVLIRRAKAANINMLRVWGGGVYEDDAFYDLCDRFGIMVWQDFMFAGGMYPADKAFLQNVKTEVQYQVNRLKHHPCIVLWCGNNEIDEAWHNWGWQDQFNIHGADSARLWQDYKTLFEDSIPAWVHAVDSSRSYIPSSPKWGWGHDESFTAGDSHYWGLWWGLEPWESFKTHTGRFVSEYGMQSMPNYFTVKTYVPANDLHYSSPAVQWHQKASEGFSKLNFYLDKYFIDSSKLKGLSLEEYTYLTQCLQYYILKNSIAIQRSKEPYNMGTLVWQLNDCWPATSWSITDNSLAPKAGWYAVKEAYRDDVRPVADSIYPKNEQLQKPVFKYTSTGDSHFTIESNVDAKFVYLVPDRPAEIFSDNYFDLKAGQKKDISVPDRYLPGSLKGVFKTISLYDILHK